MKSPIREKMLYISNNISFNEPRSFQYIQLFSTFNGILVTLKEYHDKWSNQWDTIYD